MKTTITRKEIEDEAINHCQGIKVVECDCTVARDTLATQARWPAGWEDASGNWHRSESMEDAWSAARADGWTTKQGGKGTRVSYPVIYFANIGHVISDSTPAWRPMITGQPTEAKFSPKMVRIFAESDGWHYCAACLDYLDARGTGYPSKAAAMRAARESHESQVRISGGSNFSK